MFDGIGDAFATLLKVACIAFFAVPGLIVGLIMSFCGFTWQHCLVAPLAALLIGYILSLRIR